MITCEVIFAIELGLAVASQPMVQDIAGSNPLAVWRGVAECGALKLEYEHQSSILDGPPINDNLDQRWQERLTFIYRYEFK